MKAGSVALGQVPVFTELLVAGRFGSGGRGTVVLAHSPDGAPAVVMVMVIRGVGWTSRRGRGSSMRPSRLP